MKRIALLLSGIVLLAAIVATFTKRLDTSNPVYTVSDVQMGLERHPQSWVGRTILVRGQSVIAVISPNGSGLLLPTVNGGIRYPVPDGATFRALIVPPGRRLGPVPHLATFTPRLWVSWHLSAPPSPSRTKVLLIRLGRLFPPLKALITGSPKDKGPGHIFHITLVPRRNVGCPPPGICIDALVIASDPSS